MFSQTIHVPPASRGLLPVELGNFCLKCVCVIDSWVLFCFFQNDIGYRDCVR